MPESASVLSDVRNYLTTTTILLAELSVSEKTTFTELLRHTGLPRRTVSLKLNEFKEKGWVNDEPDPDHKQRIFYSLTPDIKKEIKDYLNMSILSLTTIWRKKNANRIAGREKEGSAPCRMVIFDLDGVLYEKPWINTSDEYADSVAVSSWDLVFKEMGIFDVHEHLKALFASGVFNYMEWTEAACRALKKAKLRKKTFEDIIQGRRQVDGCKETLSLLKQNKIRIVVITGSFEELAQRAKVELGIDYYMAHCRLSFDDQGYLENWKLQPTDYEDKVKFVRKIAHSSNINLRECVYVGDDVNDISAFSVVGLSIAFNSDKEKVKRAADIVIEKGDLAEVIPYIKISKTTNVRAR